VGSPRAVYESPNNPFVAAFMGQSNQIEGEIISVGESESEIRADSGLRLFVKTSQGFQKSRRITVFVRIETLDLLPEAPREPWNAFEGKLESVSYHGSSTLYYVRINEGNRLVVEKSRQDASRVMIQRDSRVWVKIPPEECISLL